MMHSIEQKIVQIMGSRRVYKTESCQYDSVEMFPSRRRNESEMRFAREALRERQAQASAKWYFAVSGVTDGHMRAAGVFTGDDIRHFYSKRAIASFRGKLLHLRDVFTPGRRIGSIAVLPPGATAPVTLSLDNLEKDYKEKLEYKRRAVYQVSLVKEEAKTDDAPEEMDTS